MPSEAIQDFMDHIKQWRLEYDLAYENAGIEDRRLQDLLHELEFTANAKERNRVAAKLCESRRTRRENKNKVLLLEFIIQFFDDRQNREMLNRLTQLLGRQRKQEAFLQSEHTYTPRVEGVPTVMGEVLEENRIGGRKGNDSK